MNESSISYNQKFKGEEGSKITIRYEAKTEEGKSADLNSEQLTIISDALSNQVNLDVGKKHSMQITVIEKDKFSVRLDNKFSFFISKQKGYDAVSAPQNIVIIQEKIKNKTLFANFKEFFRSVYYLFYPPAYPSVAVKDRSYRTVVQEDFRSLRKGLELGKNWLSSETETKITSKEQQVRVGLNKEVESSISYAKKIEEALSKKNQSKALSSLAKEIANELFNPNMKDSIVIPAGYVNVDNTLQPVMYRFYRNNERHLCMEIYADVAEGISKFPPTIVKEFDQKTHTKVHLEHMLDAIFAPLIEKRVDQKKLAEAIKPSQTFTEIYESKVGKAEKIEEAKEETKTAEVSRGIITYEVLLTSIEDVIGNFTTDISPKDQELVSTVQSPAERVTRWFDHLAGGKISPNEKINLLYVITEQWVNDQLLQVPKASLERQKDVYQEVVATISRVTEKISKAINQGVAIESEFVPESLRTIGKRAQEQIDAISQKIRKEKMELSSSQLLKKQQSVVGIPIKPIITEVVQKRGAGISIAQGGEIDRLNQQWGLVSEKIAQLFSQQTIEMAQKREVIENFDRVAKELQAFPEVAVRLHEFVMTLATSGDIDQQEFREVLSQLFINTGFAKAILEELNRYDSNVFFDSNPDEFVHILEQIILAPHLFPMYDIPTIAARSKRNENKLYRFIRKVEDPNSYFPANSLPAIQAMRAALTLPLLINKETKSKLLGEAWVRQPELFLQEKIKPLMQEIAIKVLPDLSVEEKERLDELSLKDKIDHLRNIENSVPKPIKERIQVLLEKYEFYLLLDKKSNLDLIENIPPAIASTERIADRKVNVGTIEDDSFGYREDIVKTLGNAVQQIINFYQCAETQTDPEQKKAILEEARRRTFEIVRSLPVPGSEGAEGIPSIWYGFSEKERNDLFHQLHEMEHLLWESQMRLAKTEISGKEQFFQIKIQAIRQALIRSKVDETKLSFEKFLTKFNKPNDPITTLYNELMTDGRLRMDLIPTIEQPLAESVQQKLKDKLITSKEADQCNTAFLRLQKFTLDTDAINQVLTQDLTSSLSSEPDLHRQLLSLYHFVLRDRNVGTHEGVISADQSLERFEKGKRKPFFSEQVGEKNNFPLWSPEQLAQTETYKNSLTPNAFQSIHSVLDALVKSHFYARTSNDPNFTIHALSPTLGTPFFEGQPATMLAQSHLDIRHTVIKKNVPYSTLQEEFHEYHIVNDQGENLAEICTNGHPKYCAFDIEEKDQLSEQERQEQELLIQPQQKFNPIVKNEPTKQDQLRAVSDSRVYATFDEWHMYVTESTQNQEQAIPPAALQQLFQIRQAPDRLNGYSFTSYSPITSLNALEFIANTENQNYLKFDFVQNFLYDSLFGPFVLQQAIIYYPEEIQKQSDQLASRLMDAQEREDSELVAFYTDLIHRISQQVNLTKETLLSQGLLSGTVNGSLPSGIGADEGSGLLFSTILAAVHIREGGIQGIISLGGKETPSDLPATNLQQPLLELINKISLADQVLQQMVPESDKIFSEMFFAPEKGPLDQVKNLQLKKKLSIYLLEGYQRKMNAGDKLQPKELQEIILAYQLLLDDRIETSLTQKKNDLIDWVRGKILPTISQQEGIRNQCLQAFLHNQLKKPVNILKSTPIPNTLFSYEVELKDKTYVVNLHRMTIGGTEEENPMVREVFIPDEIIHNRAFSQAIQRTRVKAGYTKKSDGTDQYVWIEDGQKFKVTKNKEQIQIERTIEKEPYHGTYTFYPMLEVAANNQASALLLDHGMWQKKGEELPKYIFSQGSSHPIRENVFETFFEVQAGQMQIKEIKSSDGKLVASEDFSSPSPVLFAPSQSAIILLDPATKIPSEIQVKNSAISLKKEEGQWVVYLGGVKQGQVTYPKEEKILKDNFGEQWDRYVIPIQIEKTERKLINGVFKKVPITEIQYLVIPYPQTVDSTGRVLIDQDSSFALDSLMIFKKDREGIVKGPIAGELYLAHALIGQSAKTKNPTMARALLLQAESHLVNIRTERPTSDPEEMRQLQTVFSQISQSPAVELTIQTHPEAIAQNIKLLLNVRKMRKLLEAQGGGKVLLTAKENYQEKQYLAKLYEAYLVYENKQIHGMFDASKLHKAGFTLQDEEKKELDRIAETMLQDIKQCIAGGSAGFESFFGISSRLTGTLTMDAADTVNPNFLLSLVRLAKPVDKAVSLKSEKGPIPLDKLLENYWSYFISIKREGLKPKDLLFLFQESLLPPTKSDEEREHMKAMDKQARQFLLTFAKLQEQFSGEIRPYDQAEQKIRSFKDETLPSIKEGCESDKLFRQFPSLYPSFGKIRQQMQQVQVEKQTIKVREKEIISPNIEKLDKDLREMMAQGMGFSSQISEIISDSEKLFSQVDTENKRFVQQISELKKEQKNIKNEIKEASRELAATESEAHIKELEDSLTENQEALAALNEKYQEFLSTEVTAPGGVGKASKRDIVSGSFMSSYHELQEAQTKLGEILESLQKEVNSLDKMNKDLTKWVEMEKIIVPLQETSFKTSPWFTLPEKGKGKEVIQKFLDGTSGELGFKQRAKGAIGVVQEIGIYKGGKLAEDSNVRARYEDQLSIREKLENKRISNVDRQRLEKAKISDKEFAKLREEYDSTIFEKLKIFAAPLKGLEMAQKEDEEKTPITVVRGEKRAQKETFEKVSETIVAKYFTEEEGELIAKKMSDFTPSDQKTILGALGEALELRESIVSAKIESKKNMEEAKALFASRTSSEKKPQKFTPINITSLSRQDSFAKDFNKFFTGSLGFKKDVSIAKTLDAENIATVKEQKKRFVYISGKFSLNEILGPPDMDEETRVAAIGDFKEATKEFVSRLVPFEHPEIQPYGKALDIILQSFDVEPTTRVIQAAQDTFLKSLQNISSRSELLQAIETAYDKLAPFVHEHQHEQLVDRLENTLPDGESSYRSDLKKGIDNLRANDPLPFASVIREDELENLGFALESTAQDLEERVDVKKKVALELLKKLDPKELPAEVLRLRLQKKGDQELLDVALKKYRKGDFQKNPELEPILTAYLIDHTRLQALTGQKDSAAASLSTLYDLQSQRKEIFGKLGGQINDNEKKELEKKLEVIDTQWARESSKIRDFTERCQSTAHIESLGSLQPHMRKILYLQYRQGMVLRKNQIDTLQQIVSKPSLLKQLRMGLGKTSVILPFALEILASEGYNPIGMVPKALFGSNFKEMDDTTRLVFELSGNQFLFSREDVPSSLTPASLSHLLQKTKDFLQALENGEFVLTTIESKASLDDKIAEIENSQRDALKKWEDAEKKIGGEAEAQKKYQDLVNHQTALDALYQIKGVFEAKKTRIVIDEVDQVARANYTVNSEKGIKESLDPGLQQAVATIFDLLRDLPDLAPLRDEIAANNQFTLTDEQINGYIKSIGTSWWLEGKKLPEEVSIEAVRDWFAGSESPFTVQQIEKMDVSLKTELKNMRRALDSALRSSLHHKIGLNGEFDPVHKAVGVPASQGVTSKTTKYSDPLMQLVLTHMIAFYKPQGEAFLRSAAGEVFEGLQKDRQEILKILDKGGDPRTVTLIGKLHLIEDAIKKIQDLFEVQKTIGAPPSYADALSGTDPTALFLRQKFAEQVAKRKLIYVSSDQISRPVQDALRGCNVIGLTGTATRNTEFVVTGSNPDALEEIDQSGRETTAEVLLRLEKALDKGLDTEVKSYATESEQAIGQIRELAREKSGYHYLVNQAGACDKFTIEQIVKELHEAGKRPIVHLSLDGKTKLVMIEGKIKALDKLSEAEKEEVKTKGFYYYHTPHARGTHFDIPSGSKGALFLSPMVNANDRDQAAYRARALGEGHRIEIWVSQKQKEQLGGGGPVTVAQVLKIHHEQTKNDEQTEDLAAYRLHLQGFLKKGVENLKKEIQALKPEGSPLDPNNKEEFITFFKLEAIISEMFERFSIQDSGNRAYQRLLNKEMSGQGEIPTIESLTIAIRNEISRAEGLLAELDRESLGGAFALVTHHLEQTIQHLEQERGKLQTEGFKEKVDNQFPEKTTSSAAVNTTAETEAEEEAEEEQEVKAETHSEVETKKQLGSRNLLGKLDKDLLNKLKSNFAGDTLSGLYRIFSPKSGKDFRQLEDSWRDGIFISKRLQRHMQEAIGTIPPLTFLITLQQDGTQNIAAIDQFEAGQLINPSNAFSIPTYYLPLGGDTTLGSCFTLKPVRNSKGEADLIYSSAGTLTGNCEGRLNGSLKGQLGLTMIALGFTQLSDELWSDIINYWKNENDDVGRQDIQRRFEEVLGGRNPSFLTLMGEKLWNAPPEKKVELGGNAQYREELRRGREGM